MPYARRVRIASCLVLCVGMWLAQARAQAQTAPGSDGCRGPCQPASSAQSPETQASERPSHPGRAARAGAIFGLVSAGLTLSGAIAVGSLDTLRSERVGRGLLMGLSAVSVPIVAITAGVARESRKVGSPAARRLGWIGYPGVLISEILLFYGALHDRQASLGISIGVGALSACSVLAHAFDAYVTSRHARTSGFALDVSPRGASLRMRF